MRPDPIFSKNEYELAHDVEFRTKISKMAEKKGAAGLCVAWTVAWIQAKLRAPNELYRYSFEDITALVDQHLDHITRREDLTAYCQTQRLTATRAATGEISYHGGLKELAKKVTPVPGAAYIVELSEPGQFQRNTFGHVSGLFRTDNALLFFDQNFGQLRLSDLDRVQEGTPGRSNCSRMSWSSSSATGPSTRSPQTPTDRMLHRWRTRADPGRRHRRRGCGGVRLLQFVARHVVQDGGAFARRVRPQRCRDVPAAVTESLVVGRPLALA